MLAWFSLSLSPFPGCAVRDGGVETRAEDTSPCRDVDAPALLTFAYRRGLARERALPPGCCSLNAGDSVDRRRWQGDDAARASWYRRLAVLKTRAPESHDPTTPPLATPLIYTTFPAVIREPSELTCVFPVEPARSAPGTAAVTRLPVSV